MLKLTVGHEGEDFYTIQEALNAVEYNQEAEIVISEGFYKEKLFSDKRNITIKGLGKVTVCWDDGAREIMPDGLKRGTFRSYTAFFSGSYLHLENIRFENTAGPGKTAGQALALYLDCDTALLENVELFSHQDTLFLAPLPQEEREKRGFYGPRCFSDRKLNTVYVKGGSIWGGVDFIFGGADALFENVRIVSNEPGYVSAPCTHRENTGFVFRCCSFENDGLDDGSVYLMRPWRPEGKAMFIDCEYGSHINSRGVCPWPGREAEAALMSFACSSSRFSEKYLIKNEDYLPVLNSFAMKLGIQENRGL